MKSVALRSPTSCEKVNFSRKFAFKKVKNFYSIHISLYFIFGN